jgi:hypothetical protein
MLLNDFSGVSSPNEPLVGNMPSDESQHNISEGSGDGKELSFTRFNIQYRPSVSSDFSCIRNNRNIGIM